MKCSITSGVIMVKTLHKFIKMRPFREDGIVYYYILYRTVLYRYNTIGNKNICLVAG